MNIPTTNIPTAPMLSKLFSQLTGRSVCFTLASGSPLPKAKVIYGVYTLPPTEELLVVSADRLVVGELGGSLLGLPAASIAGRMDDYQADEALSDAMHEIMNIASAPISPDRPAVLTGVFSAPGQLDFRAKSILDAAAQGVTFKVSVDTSASGTLSVLG